MFTKTTDLQLSGVIGQWGEGNMVYLSLYLKFLKLLHVITSTERFHPVQSYLKHFEHVNSVFKSYLT